jgi:hypothetical protein
MTATTRLTLAATAALLLLPCVAQAQHAYTPSVEITPIVGYRWGGELQARGTDLLDEDALIDSGTAFGLLVDIPLSRHSQIELMADRQSTSFERGTLPDVDITYYHVGFLYQWTPSHLRPFVVGSLGFADIAPEGARSEDRFSASIGGGLKVALSRHVGFRLEGRGFWTDTGSGSGWSDCDGGCCGYCCGDYGSCRVDLVQSELRVGLVISF